MSDKPANNVQEKDVASNESQRHCASMGNATQLQRGRNMALVYMRSFSIICIVLHHAMCVFGKWPPNSPWAEQELPSWGWKMCSLTKDLGLSSFTFIAGFCAVQSLKKRTRISFAMRKIEHLLIPCGFFGLLYWWMFPSMMLANSPVNGSHLWYIPMILLCFAALVVTTSRIVPKIFLLGIIWGFLAIGNNYLTNHPTCFDFSNQSFRPLKEFVSYFPVFVFGFLWASLDEWWPRGRLWSSMVFCIIVSWVALEFPRSILWHCTFQLKLICWGGMIFALFSLLAARWNPPAMLLSLDRCSFGIYVAHQYLLNAALLLLGQFVFHWVLELSAVFCVAFVGGWLLTCGWNQLGQISRAKELQVS